jgi:hypothetical protein
MKLHLHGLQVLQQYNLTKTKRKILNKLHIVVVTKWLEPTHFVDSS